MGRNTMNHYYILKMLIKERQHQLSKKPGLSDWQRAAIKQPAKEQAATPRRAPFITLKTLATGGSQACSGWK